MSYDPLALLLLAAWFYSGIYALSALWKEREALGPREQWVNLLALFAGPLVLAGLACVNAFRNVKSNFSARRNRSEREQIDIFIKDSQGQPVLQAGEEDGKSGEAIFRTRKLLHDALARKASDVFLDPKPNGTLVIRFRVDGSLRVVGEMGLELGNSVVSALKVAAGMDITERRRPQDGAFSAISGKTPASFRAASVGAFGGEKVAIRVLASSSAPLSLKDAGLAGENLRILQSSLRVPSGLILICGPTGSGKTTTLYALLQNIDYSLKNVISIEDPIEHVIDKISQMEVNTRADITFAKLLRNALRQSPDVICLGEIRDEETAEIAFHAAQTGHLIIATVHSNDNLGTVDRLANLGVSLRSVAASLQLIVSQRLVRKLCSCKKRGEISERTRQSFLKAGLDTKEVSQPVGCRNCDNTGYAGRVAIFDLMIMNNALRVALEAEGATLSSIKEEIEREHGSSNMMYEGLKLVAEGITSIEEVERVSLNLE